jgi:hypothetical protein
LFKNPAIEAIVESVMAARATVTSFAEGLAKAPKQRNRIIMTVIVLFIGYSTPYYYTKTKRTTGYRKKTQIEFCDMIAP